METETSWIQSLRGRQFSTFGADFSVPGLFDDPRTNIRFHLLANRVSVVGGRVKLSSFILSTVPISSFGRIQITVKW